MDVRKRRGILITLVALLAAVTAAVLVLSFTTSTAQQARPNCRYPRARPGSARRSGCGHRRHRAEHRAHQRHAHDRSLPRRPGAI